MPTKVIFDVEHKLDWQSEKADKALVFDNDIMAYLWGGRYIIEINGEDYSCGTYTELKDMLAWVLNRYNGENYETTNKYLINWEKFFALAECHFSGYTRQEISTFIKYSRFGTVADTVTRANEHIQNVFTTIDNASKVYWSLPTSAPTELKEIFDNNYHGYTLEIVDGRATVSVPPFYRLVYNAVCRKDMLKQYPDVLKAKQLQAKQEQEKEIKETIKALQEIVSQLTV